MEVIHNSQLMTKSLKMLSRTHSVQQHEPIFGYFNVFCLLHGYTIRNWVITMKTECSLITLQSDFYCSV
jgi:hypothetical protein